MNSNIFLFFRILLENWKALSPVVSKGGFSFVQSAFGEPRNIPFLLKIAACGISLIISGAA